MVDEERRERAWLEAEERVRHRTGPDGSRWTKVYFGGGEHLRAWLEQCVEIAGEENVEVEPVEAGPLACFSAGGEPPCRIWVRDRRGDG